MRSVILIILFIYTFNVTANTYYVATNGNDTSNGDVASPWKTIQKAANTLVAGDTVFVRSGTYNERVEVQNSGTINNYIVFTNYQNDIVTIDGTNISWGGSWNGLFDVSYKNYIVISGFKVNNADYGGIWADSSSNIIIENNHTYNTFSCGIGIWNCNYITIRNNEIELACNDGEQECISIANSNNCNIYMNNIHNNGIGTNGGEGIDVKQGSHDVNVFQNSVHHINNRLGIYADAWDTLTYNINIYQNSIHHCSETGIAVASEAGGTIKNVNIYNNIVYFNKYGGIELGSWSDISFPGKKPLENIKIINNTCYKNGEYDGGWGYGIVVDNPDAKNVIIRNNICSNNSAQIAIQQIDSGRIVDHNLIYGNNMALGTIYGSDSVISNPLFIDTLAFNLHLNNNSPAINTGDTTSAPKFDFDNNTRPYGGNIDIGAFENNSSEIRNVINFKEIIRIFPNPFTDNLNIYFAKNIESNYNIQLIDNSGKIVLSTLVNTTKNNSVIINRKNLSSGIYFLNIFKNNYLVSTKKVIIK